MSLALTIAVQAGVPTIIWGPPGAGKTSYINAFGTSLGLTVETVIASIREPADFAGLPVVSQHPWRDLALAAVDSPELPEYVRQIAAKMLGSQEQAVSGHVTLAPPAWVRNLIAAGGGILFLDEVSTAPPAVQAALLRVILDRVVGDETLPEATMIVAAANPPESAAGGWDLSPPLANRFAHLEWHTNADAWVEGMLRGWPTPEFVRLPDGWEKEIPQARALIAGFIRHQPHKLNAMPKEASEAGRAWPSPRSWDMAARLMAAALSVGQGQDVALELIGACVGQAYGLEFYNWVRELDLPDPEVLLANPASFKLPSRGDQVYAVLGAVISATVNRLDDVRWLACWSVLEQAVEQGAPDIAASAARTLVMARKPEFTVPVQQARKLLPLLQQAGRFRY